MLVSLGFVSPPHFRFSSFSRTELTMAQLLRILVTGNLSSDPELGKIWRRKAAQYSQPGESHGDKSMEWRSGTDWACFAPLPSGISSCALLCWRGPCRLSSEQVLPCESLCLKRRRSRRSGRRREKLGLWWILLPLSENLMTLAASHSREIIVALLEL